MEIRDRIEVAFERAGRIICRAEYRNLVARLDAGPVGLPEPKQTAAKVGWREILEILYTPEEAALAARLPLKPASLHTIAARIGVSSSELEPRLNAMADKGLVMDLVHPETGKTSYFLSPPVVGFFEFSLMRAHDSIPKKRMADALHAYTHGDPTFASEVFGHATVVGRALANEAALHDVPDVLEWERATALIEDSRTCAVALCYCRHEAEHHGEPCAAPMESCLSLNAGADFVIRRGFGRKIDKSEALELMQMSRESGLAQIADNVQQQPSYICNCCGCCCGQLRAINDFGLPAVNPSGFLASSDLSKCSGCARCARACPISAITMTPHRTPAKHKNEMTPVVDEALCIGCGVCTNACGKDAMQMSRRQAAGHVPQNAVERILRQSIERGRLGHLLADAGDTLGSRFLGGLVQGVCNLPGVQRALASEQLKSRFVAYTLRTVKSPTE